MRRFFLCIALVSAPAAALAQPGDYYGDDYAEYDPADYDYNSAVDFDMQFDDAEVDWDAPDHDYVWEDGYMLEDGTVVEGFYRLRARPNYRWVPGMYRGGAWVAAHWEPVAIQRNHVWEPGFRGPDGYWVIGYQRPLQRSGYRWVVGAYRGGAWVHGYWEPAQRHADQVWVAGYWTDDGRWVDGHWRHTRRDGFRWVAGQWRYGRWVPGYWQPASDRPGYVWAGGYWGPSGWVEGQWRVNARRGYRWIDGYYGPAGWVPGHWERDRRRAVKRRYRVRRVDRVREARRDYVRQWRKGKIVQRRARRHRQGERLENRGDRRIREGERMERRGRAIERRGEATGNRRLERKGERMQRRGERLERKGKRDRRRGKRIQRNNR